MRTQEPTAGSKRRRVTATATADVHVLVRDLSADRVLDYERMDLVDAVVDAGRPDVALDHRLDEHLPGKLVVEPER